MRIRTVEVSTNAYWNFLLMILKTINPKIKMHIKMTDGSPILSTNFGIPLIIAELIK